MIHTKSWCQRVLDLLDLSFADLLGQIYMEHLGHFDYFLGLCITDGPLLTFSVPFLIFPLFLSNKGGNKWIIVDLYGICKISP